MLVLLAPLHELLAAALLRELLRDGLRALLCHDSHLPSSDLLGDLHSEIPRDAGPGGGSPRRPRSLGPTPRPSPPAFNSPVRGSREFAVPPPHPPDDAEGLHTGRLSSGALLEAPGDVDPALRCTLHGDLRPSAAWG